MQAVLFDLWETLVHDPSDLSRARQLWRAANVRRVLSTAGIEANLDLVDAALGPSLSHTLSLLHDDGKDLNTAGRVMLFVDAFVAIGAPAPPPEAHPALQDAICTMTHGLYPHRMPHAIETLAALKGQGLKTALVSNAGITTAPTLREMLDHYGLSPYLDALVFSDELEIAKPSAGIFTAALDAIGCSAADAVFVGDSPHNDISGAQTLGMRAVKIGIRHVDGIVADADITDLDELPRVLDSLKRSAS